MKKGIMLIWKSVLAGVKAAATTALDSIEKDLDVDEDETETPPADKGKDVAAGE